MIAFTVDDIMREKPCGSYTQKLVEDLFGGRERLTPHDIARLEIPAEERIWILGRLLYRLSPYRSNRVARLIALDVEELRDNSKIVWEYLITGYNIIRLSPWYTEWYSSRNAAFDVAWDSAKYNHNKIKALKKYLILVVKAFDPFYKGE